MIKLITLKKEENLIMEEDEVDLSALHDKSLVRKIRKIIADIKETGDYVKFKGKRLTFDRTLISIPLWDYRLLYKDENGILIQLEVVSHNDYNGISRKKRK